MKTLDDIKLWGNPATHYDVDGDQIKSPVVLMEVSIEADPTKLREIAKHFLEVADEMETKSYDHWHWRDTTAMPDIVICRPQDD